MDNFQDMINMLDNIKHKIKDGEYKDIVEKIAEIKKQNSRYVKAHYIQNQADCYEDGETTVRHTRGKFILKVVEDEDIANCEISLSLVNAFKEGRMNPIILRSERDTSYIVYKIDEM